MEIKNDTNPYCLIALLFAVMTGSVNAGIYTLGELSDNAPAGYSHNTFSDVYSLALRSKSDCEKCDSYSVIESRGRVLRTYWNATFLGRSDYADAHFIIINARHSKDSSEIIVISDSGQVWNIDNVYGVEGRNSVLATIAGKKGALAIGVSRKAELIQISETELIIDNFKTHVQTKTKLPAEFEVAHIGTGGNHNWAMIGIDKEQKVWMGDGKQWTDSVSGVVGEHADRSYVLSVFPNGDELVGAAYVNINQYNKGVMLFYGKLNGPTRHAWAINSDEKNYGFFPAVQWKKGNVIVAGRNSSDDKEFSVSIPENVVRTMTFQVPAHALGNEKERALEFMAGGSVAYVNWSVKSRVENLSEVKYNVANTLYKGFNLEGRYNNRNLALSYLQNQAEDLALQTGGALIERGKFAAFRVYGF